MAPNNTVSAPWVGALGCLLSSHSRPCAPSASSREHWLTVPLDWSAPEAHGRFKVRYHVDAAHFDPTAGRAPIFVHMGGEGTTASANCGDLGARHGALCVAIEHRFYGLSLPSAAAGGCSTHNYQLGLSVENALADAAAVIDLLRAAYAPSETTQMKGHQGERTVLVFGGSYSGGLCAWFRQAYPAHASGCVASSGVVNAILDFDAFDLAISSALERTQSMPAWPARASLSRPTGAACAMTLRAVAAAIDRSFDSGGGMELRARFNASGLRADAVGDADLAYALADAPAMAVQYGAKRWLCDTLAASLSHAPRKDDSTGLVSAGAQPAGASDEALLGALAAVVSTRYGSAFASSCFYNSDCLLATAGLSPYTEASGAHASEDVVGRINSRSWRFQKCSQLAYLQRAPQASAAPSRLRSRRLSLEALLGQCELVFGSGTRHRLMQANAAFNARFGGARPTSGAYPDSTSILYLGFSDDPWQAATVPMVATVSAAAVVQPSLELAPEAVRSGNVGRVREQPYGLSSCFTECDGCGHCGAGVPPDDAARCGQVIEAFVHDLLAGTGRRAQHAQ